MADYVNNTDRELDWEDTIEKDSQFELLPAGDYNFRVTGFERGRFNGSEKIPACNQATLTLTVSDGKHTGTVTTRLLLHSKMEWKLCEFFTAIGQRKHGEQLRMNWGKVIDSYGVCKVKVREWTGNDGAKKQGNDIDKFYDPLKAPSVGPELKEETGGGDLPKGWGSDF